MQRAARGVLLTATALALAACAGNRPGPNQLFLMPAPEVFDDGEIDPFIDNDPISRGVLPGILYATDRRPAEAGDRKYARYTHERGHALRLGLAETRLGIDEEITWEEARRVSLLKNRTTNYPIEVAAVEEFGILAETVRPFDTTIELDDAPKQRFFAEIDARLASSPRKDVYVYVHGYKVNFENPILVAAELWHFLGYNGAFVAYSWPTKYSTFAYLADLDSAINSARNLRTLMVQIARNTAVERIHVVGYSMGTRIVSRMLADFGIYGQQRDDEALLALKLENVILVGSDIDRSILGGYLVDGALRVPQSLTIYQSQRDGALGMSRFVFGRERTGQAFTGDLNEKTRRFLDNHPRLRVIDVSDADGGKVVGGHGYFRKSPWVSSDILMTLMYNLGPGDRGLVRDADRPIWRFPPDYVQRLRESLGRANPALAAGEPPP